jgi:predicted nucleic acid-binding protein
LNVVCDTGPLIAAADRRSRPHPLAAALINELGRGLILLDVVLAEADYLLRSRVSVASARHLLDAVVAGAHSPAFLSPGLLRRATELDKRHADLGLGLVDASIMAYAERHDLPILTFDFRDFRATTSERGPWRLVLNEKQVGH